MRMRMQAAPLPLLLAAQQLGVNVVPPLLMHGPLPQHNAVCPAGDSPITLEEEVVLRLFYQQSLKNICSQRQLPSKVLVRAGRQAVRWGGAGGCMCHHQAEVLSMDMSCTRTAAAAPPCTA